ncbi:MAG TPA: ribosome assembly RNA-binding protein YhbY [Firmicutes bacterium]|nr:ribosome assembly RNA-binding protein YhbY [Bacillota bacterium]
MLTSKQRAFLRSMANSLDPILHVGKGELSDALYKQADDALTARELLKGKALEACPLTSREAAERIAQAVGAEVVQVIGRTFVLYRPNPKEPKIQLPREARRG